MKERNVKSILVWISSGVYAQVLTELHEFYFVVLNRHRVRALAIHGGCTLILSFLHRTYLAYYYSSSF